MRSEAMATAGGDRLTGPFRSLWRHRELYRRVLLRDIQATYRGSVLGLAWIVLIPLFLVTIYTFVFGAVLHSTWVGATRSPFEVPLIFFTGLTVFSFFMEVISRATNHIRDNRTYVTKIIFPVDILCWVLVGTALFKLCVNLFLLLVFLVFVTGQLPLGVFLLPILIVPFVLLTLGMAWILAAVGAFVRDLSHVLQALAPIIMFISPVFYSVQQVPEGFQAAYFLNPLTFMLESTRNLLFFDTVFSARDFVIYMAASLIVFVVGYSFFQKLRPGFSDVI
ncbi:ABC transporter permease [Pseudaminobacter sp. NGMCC 1.201702]|uniref:ABC transporter permease n=1 Tax=Pseudaminobacter sp. NGMCC 1.201702 TaxID=3391825 RepID=UPI0039F0FEC5